MSNLINSEFKPHRSLGVTDEDWATLKTTITDYLITQESNPTVTVVAVRALDVALDDDSVWRQIKSELNLVELV